MIPTPDAPPPDAETPPQTQRNRHRDRSGGRDRSWGRLFIYKASQRFFRLFFRLIGGLRGTGHENVPGQGPALVVSNHQSFWDVFIIACQVPRPLNFVARSSLFTPILRPWIRLVGGFPIQRDGIGAQGFKETLRRLKIGGLVLLFPEGTRTPDGALRELKPGIATLSTRARVPIIPIGIAGAFEAWPRHHRFPRPHPLRLHIGPPIAPEELDGLTPDAATTLIRDRMKLAIETAQLGLANDLGRPRTEPDRTRSG